MHQYIFISFQFTNLILPLHTYFSVNKFNFWIMGLDCFFFQFLLLKNCVLLGHNNWYGTKIIKVLMFTWSKIKGKESLENNVMKRDPIIYKNFPKTLRIIWLNQNVADLVDLTWSGEYFLTHSFLMHPFSTSWKYQKTVRFSDVFRWYRKGALVTNGLTKTVKYQNMVKNGSLDLFNSTHFRSMIPTIPLKTSAVKI